jgi:hypothetical protein
MQPHSHTKQAVGVARFELGRTLITPGAEEALDIAGQTHNEFLRRHAAGDWGELSDADIKENELSLEQGFRLLSRYETANGERFWIITEADRSATTILLPHEY